jgi:predicted negative regulator of RcsB-dependent stress response
LYEFVMENGYPKAITVVARERLARVLLDQGEPGQALTVLEDVVDITGFESRYAEVRGDIHFDQGRMAEAEAAYLEALDLLEDGAGDRGKLVMKLESMGAEIPEVGSES